MKNTCLLSAIAWSLSLTVSAQVKIGYDAASPFYNDAVLLELNNNPAAAANTWKSLLLPYVDFTSAAFTDSATWGIAGAHTAGALVYNIGNRIKDGFAGPGFYVWNNGAWVPLKESGGGNALGSCGDPGPNPGDLGCVVFAYRGSPVIYTTVRAADGRIWLQQNLGSQRVGTAFDDSLAYGDYFQWGRWDDGHQLKNSSTSLAATLVANNPSGLGTTGSPNFYIGEGTIVPPNPYWWGDGTSADSVSAHPPSATNGRDPCAALGTGWRLPAQQEWATVVSAENITNTFSGYASRLKLTAAGQRSRVNGSMDHVGTVGTYWSRTAQTGSYYVYYLVLMSSMADPSYNMLRGSGQSCRCIRD